ncbi:hypothetical protein EI94DRAFT_1273836 [Lactarius quietus]|nr:hypothetical protein EI94DRAFT_1273836 [Lactarius quietus]
MHAAAYTSPSPDTYQYSTNSLHEPTQYDSDSPTLTFETASVSPSPQLYSPRPYANASHPAVSPPSLGSLAEFITPDNSQPRNDVAVAESETSSVPSSVKTFQASTSFEQNRTTNITATEEPNFCHLCGVSFTQPQVFRRHLKDKHGNKESCTHCSSFKWSRGRPYLYRRHLKLKHPQFTSSEDQPPRQLRVVGTHRSKTSNRRTQAKFAGLSIPYAD